MKKEFRFLLLMAVSIFTLTNCNQQKQVSYELNNITLVLEPPVFSGSNTFQTEIPVDVNRVLKQYNITSEKIKNVNISSIDINSISPANFNNYENLLIQFFGEKTDMADVASLSPISKDVSAVKPIVIQDKDVKDFLKASKLGIVLDANFLQDDTVKYELQANIKFNITY